MILRSLHGFWRALRACKLLHCGHAFGHFPVFHIELQMVVRTSMILSSLVRISSEMLSMLGDLSIFSELTAVSLSCLSIGSCVFLFSLMTYSTAVSPVTGWLYSSVKYSVHLLIIASSNVKQFHFLSWIVLCWYPPSSRNPGPLANWWPPSIQLAGSPPPREPSTNP